MAGIISNVDSDVQKLRKLKNEIEEVKKSLKGINIKVDIDIAKGLEAQLKSLTDQYHSLVTKIAEAEGKILLSTKKINDASEKIIQAQEKVSKAAVIPTQMGKTNLQGVNATETASIQMQAKAYEELKAEINGILGTREANVKRMIDEMNAIRLINAEIKKITKSQGQYSTLSSTQQKRIEQLNNSLLTHKAALSEVRQTLSNNVKLDNVSATSMNGLSQSLSRMKVAYRELTEEERNSPIGKELLTSINQADAKIKELDATIGNHQRNVGNYGKQWNGLSMSIQQVGRELPSLAYGPKVFFSAISNNLPILADEIKRARIEYDLLKKSGQSATPVWKQIASSLFSWQSALTVGITLLTLYGDKVVDWVAGLFKAKDTIKELLSAEQEMALARKKAVSDSIKERTELGLLYKKLKDTSLSVKERTAAVNEWMKKYPQHSNIMNGELVSLGKLELAYRSLSKQIIESAKARSYSDKITELESKRFDANFKRLNQKNTLGIAEDEYLRTKEIFDKLQQDYDNGKSVGQALSVARVPYMNAKEEYEKQKRIYDNLEKETNDYASKINHIAEQIKIDKLYPQPKNGSYDYWQQQVQIADVALKQIDSSQKKLMDAGKFEGIDEAVVKSYKDNVKKLKEAEKELGAYGSYSKQENQAEKLRQQQEKYNLLLNKQALEQKRSAEDLENQTEQARINAMKEGSARTLEQMRLDHKKEMQQLDRQQEDLLRKKIKDEEDKFNIKEDEKVAKDSKYVKQTFDGSKVSLSQSEKNAFDNQRMYLDLKQSGEMQAYLDKERQAWDEYLSEYGTFQEKKEALSRLYSEKIAKAASDGERAALKKELEGKEKDLDLENFKKSINFADVFGDLDAQTTGALTSLREKLAEYINKAAKDLKPADLKELQDAFKNINFEIKGRTPFKEFTKDLQTYKDAQEAVNKAQEDLNTVTSGGEIIVGTYIDSTGKICTKLLTQEQAEINLTKAQKKRKEAMSGLAKSASGIAEDFSNISNAANKIVNTLEEDFGVKVSDDVKGLVDGFGELSDGISSVAQSAAKGDIAGVIGGVVQSVGGVFKAISSIFGLGGNSTKKYFEDLKEQLDGINKIYDKIIENSKEKIKFGEGFAAVNAAADAMDTLNKKLENYRALVRAGIEYKDGSKENAGWHSNKNVGEWGFAQMSQLVGKNITSVYDLVDLKAEELYTIMTKLPGVWGQMDEHVRTALEDIIACKDEAKELGDALGEAVTGVSFDSFRDGFIDQLADMDNSFEDMTNNFEEYLRKSILGGMVANGYKDRIQKLYDDWTLAGKDQTYTEQEISDLRKQKDDLLQSMLAERENLANAFGWESSSSQEATKGAFQTMSQDTGTELNGRFTALQAAGEEIKNQNISQSQSLNILTMKADAILSVNTEVRNIADDTRDLIANSYLELVQISENTGNSAKYLKDIKADIAEVKKNTSKL